MIFTMNQDTYGDVLGYEGPGMQFEITRYHKTQFQRVEILKLPRSYVRKWDPCQHQWSDSEPEVDTIGIYVRNPEGKNREFVI